MLTHPRSTLRVLCRLMRLRSGHVTLLRAEFQSLKLSPQSDLRHRAASRWALPQISSSAWFWCRVFGVVESNGNVREGEKMSVCRSIPLDLIYRFRLGPESNGRVCPASCSVRQQMPRPRPSVCMYVLGGSRKVC